MKTKSKNKLLKLIFFIYSNINKKNLIQKEKQRELELQMLTGGRSSTPQPNDLNEQVVKIMTSSMQFDRHQVLEVTKQKIFKLHKF